MLPSGAEIFAQTAPGGSLGFSIIDPRTGDVRPRVSDLPGSRADSIEVGGLIISLSTPDHVVPISLDSGYFAGGDPVFHARGGVRRLLLTVKGRGDVMTVEIWNLGPGERHLLYDIPFRPGEWTIDLEPSRRDDRGFHRFESVEPHLLRIDGTLQSSKPN